MILLPSVTLFAIDCIHPLKVIEAMQWSTRHTRFAEIVLLTDTQRHPKLPTAFNHGLAHIPIRIVHHVESDRKGYFPRKDHYPVAADYELASLREPSLHVKTQHLLFFESDSAICNPWAWDPGWLNYDYIGAPWSQHFEEGWAPCDGHTNNVGNGGFSLRSVHYCRATRALTDAFKGDPGLISSDAFPCLTKRDWLIKNYSIKFAPERVAADFSCENLPYRGQWGAHGRWTFALNNWGGRFATIRP